MRRYDTYYDCEYEEYLPPRRLPAPRHHWGLVPWALLLGAILFGCGFLFGTVRAQSAPTTDDTPVKTYTVPASAGQSSASDVPPVVPQAPKVSDDPPQPVNEDWALLLVNRDNPVPAGYSVPDLVELRNNQSIDRRAYPDLQRMMDDCRAAGLSPLICSSYRTNEVQTELFENKVAQYTAQEYDRTEAEALAAQWVARPGTSEHEVGLAVDIVDTAYQNLDERQEQTDVQQWLLSHCAEYGFILRYPTEKSDLTGVQYEPWHYRYVGSAAGEIMEQGICLEEYLTK